MRRLHLRVAAGTFAALGLVLAGPSVAAANTSYCVPNTSISNCPNGSTGEASIDDALSASAIAGAHNTIHLGADTFSETNLVDAPGNSVSLVGAGLGKTKLDPTTPGGFVLLLEDAGSSVSDLSLQIPAGDNGSGDAGLFLQGASATRVAITTGVGGQPHFGVTMSGGSFSHGSISVPTSVTTGVGLSPAGTISDTTITGRVGIAGGGTFLRDRILATEYGLAVSSGAITLDDCLVRMSHLSFSPTYAVGEPTSQSESMTLRHDTLAGDGTAGSIGLDAEASAAGANTTVNDSVDSSVFRGFVHSVLRSATGSGGPSKNATSNVSLNYTDVDPATLDDVGNNPNGGTATGGITQGATDVDADPGFASTDPANPLGFTLKTTSPLIDHGDPLLHESPTDVLGKPRVLAGRVGAPAVTDIGASEYQPLAPSVVARASRAAASTGSPVGFDAAVSLVNPGDVVTSVLWSFGDGSRASGASVSHAFARAGSHSATVTVRDLNGFVRLAKVTVVVRAVKPRVSAVSLTGVGKGKPRLGLTVAAVSPAPRLSKLVLSLPKSLKAKVGKGLSVLDKRGHGLAHSASVKGRALTIVLKSPASGVVLKLGGNALKRSGKPGKHIVVGLKVTDAAGNVTTRSLRLAVH